MATQTTPKRKRRELHDQQSVPLLQTAQFSFDPLAPVEDGSASPRSRVARRFQGLVLESGVRGVLPARSSRSMSPKPILASIDDAMQDQGVEEGSRKRMKVQDVEMPDSVGDSEATVVEFRTTTLRFAPKSSSPDLAEPPGQTATIPELETTSQPNTTGLAGQKPLPPLPKTADPPRRKRSGTPPLSSRTKPSCSNSRDSSEEPERVITDPVRASLTWHEDEITVYDENDPDDDGTGINGIGFKPTPAIAYARTVKRKKQLAEYRKREEREARAKRSMRRRTGVSPAPGPVNMKEKVEERRVRFLEAAIQMIGA
jgi:hypothetical protein